MTTPRSLHYGGRWVRVKNVSGEDIPPYSVVEITGASSDDGILNADKPSSSGDDYRHGLSGPATIKSGDHGDVTFDLPAWASFDSSDGTPANGDLWGAKSGSWKLGNTGDSNFPVLGSVDTTNEVMLVGSYWSAGKPDVELFVSDSDRAYPDFAGSVLSGNFYNLNLQWDRAGDARLPLVGLHGAIISRDTPVTTHDPLDSPFAYYTVKSAYWTQPIILVGTTILYLVSKSTGYGAYEWWIGTYDSSFPGLLFTKYKKLPNVFDKILEGSSGLASPTTIDDRAILWWTEDAGWIGMQVGYTGDKTVITNVSVNPDGTVASVTTETWTYNKGILLP